VAGRRCEESERQGDEGAAEGVAGKAFAAGLRIRGGDYSRLNLEKIVAWKSERRLALISENSDSEIADALRLAPCAEEPRSAVAV